MTQKMNHQGYNHACFTGLFLRTESIHINNLKVKWSIKIKGILINSPSSSSVSDAVGVEDEENPFSAPEELSLIRTQMGK